MPYCTTNLGLASFLRYALGDEAHFSTTREADGRTITFRFSDDKGRCSDLATGYFSKRGVPVTDARLLLEASRDIRRTSTVAIKAGRWDWENKE